MSRQDGKSVDSELSTVHVLDYLCKLVKLHATDAVRCAAPVGKAAERLAASLQMA